MLLTTTPKIKTKKMTIPTDNRFRNQSGAPPPLLSSSPSGDTTLKIKLKSTDNKIRIIIKGNRKIKPWIKVDKINPLSILVSSGVVVVRFIKQIDEK